VTRKPNQPKWSSLGPILLGIVSLCLALAALPGCRSGALGVRPATSFVVPDWDSLEIKTLAYLGMGSSVGDEIARQTAEEMADTDLRSEQNRFVVLGLTESRRRASSKGVGDEAAKLIRVWRDARMADQFLVQKFCEGIGVDGVIFGEVTDWKKEKVDWTIEGQSSTQVTMRLCIYSGKTGQLAWEASSTQRKESLKYTPNEATGVYTDRSGMSRAERPGSIGPEPPKPEEVAEDVLRSILASLPSAPARP